MKYSTIISPDRSEPITLTQSIERANREFNYWESIMPQNPINISPFKKEEEIISPTEFVTKFIQENFKK